jgi:flagellar M-ring protein FliF
MAFVEPDEIGASLDGISSLPLMRQVGLMIGFAATIALASYRLLYGNLSDQDMIEITTALDQAGIEYDISASNASILVDGAHLHEARMKLVKLGLPRDSGTGSDTDMAYTSSQFDYRKKLEDYYIKHIEEIVEPIAGIGKVKAQVVADLDFIDSEQTMESKGASNSSRPARHPSGMIKRLSAAVVIDDKVTGGGISEPLTDTELERINGLVKEAIGFNAARGDSVNVINAPFHPEVAEGPLPETPFLDQPWVWDIAKEVVGLAVVLLLILGVLKPVLKSLAEKGVAARRTSAALQSSEMSTLPGQQISGMSAPDYERNLESAKSFVQQQPQHVAQIIKDWVEQDG